MFFGEVPPRYERTKRNKTPPIRGGRNYIREKRQRLTVKHASPHHWSGYIAERSEIATKKTGLKELYEMMFPNYPDTLTVTELRKMLGISCHLAYKLLGDGCITAVKIGIAYKIPKVSIINYAMEGGKRNAN